MIKLRSKNNRPIASSTVGDTDKKVEDLRDSIKQLWDIVSNIKKEHDVMYNYLNDNLTLQFIEKKLREFDAILNP